MKKLFLLALTFLMICGPLFAAEDPSNTKTETATILLNLSGAHSVVNVGFIKSMELANVDLDKITSLGFANSEKLTDLNIELDAGSLKTKPGSFAIWYFFNAVNTSNADDGVKLMLNVTPFSDTAAGSSADKVGFTLLKGDVKSEGKENPDMEDSYIIPATNSLDIQIFDNIGLYGLHRGYLSYTVQAFEYAEILALNYDSTLTLSIVAP